MKLNNKGFTLVEVLAVIVILGILSTIMISSVGGMLNQNKENNYNNLTKSIKAAAKMLISDYRYDIKLAEEACDSNNQRNIETITIDTIENTINSKVTVDLLIEKKYLSTNKDNKIIDPRNDKEIDRDNSYIIVKYNCIKKDYDYGNITITPKNN